MPLWRQLVKPLSSIYGWQKAQHPFVLYRGKSASSVLAEIRNCKKYGGTLFLLCFICLNSSNESRATFFSFSWKTWRVNNQALVLQLIMSTLGFTPQFSCISSIVILLVSSQPWSRAFINFGLRESPSTPVPSHGIISEKLPSTFNSHLCTLTNSHTLSSILESLSTTLMYSLSVIHSFNCLFLQLTCSCLFYRIWITTAIRNSNEELFLTNENTRTWNINGSTIFS